MIVFVREPGPDEVSGVQKWSATTEKILSLVKSSGSVSRSELVKLTGYKPSTVTAQLSILKRLGAVRVSQDMEGKRAVGLQWSLAPTSKHITLYFHAGGVKIRMARVRKGLADDVFRLVKELSVSSDAIEEEAGNVLYVFMKALPCTRKRAILKEVVKRLDPADVHYWAWKFGNENQARVASAFKRLQGLL